MKRCLIYQPAGLGDIIWIQPIIDNYIKQGYDIFYPVIDLYYNMLFERIKKPKLHWLKQSDNFFMKSLYGTEKPVTTHNNENEDLYLPISFADRYLPNCSVMISKYYFTNTPVVNWHESFNIKRIPDKENRVFSVYNFNKTSNYSLINMTYGTPPGHVTRKDTIITDGNMVNMSFEKDKEHNINLFDWIEAIENASEIHTVETSLCYLVDKYAKTDKLYMYEKRRSEDPPTYYRLTNLVYRNPNWKFMK